LSILFCLNFDIANAENDFMLHGYSIITRDIYRTLIIILYLIKYIIAESRPTIHINCEYIVLQNMNNNFYLSVFGATDIIVSVGGFFMRM